MPILHAHQLEPLPAPDLDDAVRAVVHDPLWFLARQWQMGEFQGENASTPVEVRATIRTRRISYTAAALPGAPPSLEALPPEVLVESENNDWWTIGRRLKVGAELAAQLGLAPQERWLFADPPPPYDLVSPAWDALTILADGDLDTSGLDPSPAEPAHCWVDDELVYEHADAFDAEGTALHLRRHRGGRMDWYSVDAGAGPAEPAGEFLELEPLIPARLDFPGRPRAGTWEIEDAQHDYGSVGADAKHTSTAILVNLVQGHRDEWFAVPIGAETGVIVEITEFWVRDAFDQEWDSTTSDGLNPPTDLVATPFGPRPWALFDSGTSGLILWNAVDRTLESEPIEQVQFGVDDQSNLVWAVERRLDSRSPRPIVPESGAYPLIPPPPGDQTVSSDYRYVPGMGAEAYWIPYALDAEAARRELARHRLRDLSFYPALDLPEAAAAVLRDAGRIREGVVPIGGVQVERRWQLARASTGAPQLWIERRRGPLMSPPARTLRFDVAMATDPEEV